MKKLFLFAVVIYSGSVMAHCCHKSGTNMYHDFGHKMCPHDWMTAVQSNCDAYTQKVNDQQAKMEVAIGS